jgi:glutathionylspermidine synthase
MQRHTIQPRSDWEAKLEQVGVLHHTASDEPYWDDGHYYSFHPDEIAVIEKATNDCHAMCLEAVDRVIQRGMYNDFCIPNTAIPLIEESWFALDGDGAPSIYGRFDFSYEPGGTPQMLEYNSDTPTSLAEASVAQWYWLKDNDVDMALGAGEFDQFNSIHEKLVGTWRHLRPYLTGSTLFFASLSEGEDVCTVNYLRDTAEQAGLKTRYLSMDEIGWNPMMEKFVASDPSGTEVIESIFKLYPWEWMVHEAFSVHLNDTVGKVQWIEPAWKMILSNKAILPVLWEMFPGHPNLLPAYRQDYMFNSGDAYVVKPLLSREGANITIINPYEGNTSTSGEYGEEGFVYQALAPLPRFDDDFGPHYPVIGSWVIGGEAAGMGIRESSGPITNNLSRFVPHIIGG